MRFYGDMTQEQIGQQPGISQMRVSRKAVVVPDPGNRITDPHPSPGLCQHRTDSKGSPGAIAHEIRILLIRCSVG